MVARAGPMVRRNNPISPFCRAKTCSIAERTRNFAALATAVRRDIGRPCGFRRWMRERMLLSPSHASFVFDRDAVSAHTPAAVSELLAVWWTRCLARGGDPLELHRAEIADGRVASLRVVEKFEVVEHVRSDLVAGAIDFGASPLGALPRSRTFYRLPGKVGRGFSRMSRSAFSLASSRRSWVSSCCSGLTCPCPGKACWGSASPSRAQRRKTLSATSRSRTA